MYPANPRVSDSVRRQSKLLSNVRVPATHLPHARTIRVDAGNLGLIEIGVEQPEPAVSSLPSASREPATAHSAPSEVAASRWREAYARATAGADPTFVPHWRHRDHRPADPYAVRPLEGAHR